MTGRGDLTGEQPPPVPNDGPDMWREVIADMEARRLHGIGEYGTPLQPHNGRQPLTDAYQEVLDQSVYLRQAIAEQEQLAADLRLFFDCMSCLWVYSSGAAPRQAEARLREFARTGLVQGPSL